MTSPSEAQDDQASAGGTSVEALKGHAAMLTFAAIISGSFSLGHAGGLGIDPGALTTVRFLIAIAAMAAIVVVAGEVREARVSAPWRYPVLGGLLGTYFVLMFEGLQLSDPVSLGAIFTTTPLMTALFARPILGQTPSPLVMASLLVACAGAIWVIFRADIDALLAFDLGLGELIFLVGCSAHAVYLPLVRRFNRGESGRVFTLWTLVGGFFVIGVYAAPAILETDWAGLPMIVWVTAAYLGLFASAGTFFLMRYAALRLPAAKVMAYGYLIPSFVILFEGLAGHGWVAPPVLFGVAATIAALGMLVLARDA